jgi:hypothetical protein
MHMQTKKDVGTQNVVIKLSRSHGWSEARDKGTNSIRLFTPGKKQEASGLKSSTIIAGASLDI